MKSLIVVTLFACVLVCANAHFATSFDDDKNPLPDESFPVEEETGLTTEDYEDGNDENGKDDAEDDNDDDDGGVFNYYASKRGSWRSRRRGSWRGRSRGRRRSRGKGRGRGGKSGWQKCDDALRTCGNDANFTRDECVTKFKDCRDDYRKTRTMKNTTLALAVGNCWTNCTDIMYDCLKDMTNSIDVCLAGKDTCGLTCKRLYWRSNGSRRRYVYRRSYRSRGSNGSRGSSGSRGSRGSRWNSSGR